MPVKDETREHIRNRTEEQKEAARQEAKEIGALGNGVETCLVCAAPLAEDGMTCTRIDSNVHTDAHKYYPTPRSNPDIEEDPDIGDWITKYHSFDEMESAPPAAFLIEGFLQQEGATALAAPVAQRKSLIALNVAHALCTGEPLFDYFKVTRKPNRVLYLCPEMGIRSFKDRLQKIGLMPYVDRRLFCQTMNSKELTELSKLTPEELEGAAVIVDTAVRYIKGDENSSADMRAFSDELFRLMRDGALAVLVLYHSAKGTKESAELSLENAMRGSGELGAAVSACWATRLQDQSDPYHSASYLVNVKQRDYESQAFEATCAANCRMTIVDKPGDDVRLNRKPVGGPSNRDGKDGVAIQILQSNPDMSLRDTVEELKKTGIKRGKDWIRSKRLDLLTNQ